MDRDELLGREADAWAALEEAALRVPAGLRAEEGAVPGWSVQDLVWHCGWWADYVARNLDAMAAGTYQEEDHDDAYWNDLNEKIATESKSMTWEDVLARSADARARARASLLALPELSEAAVADFSDETFVHYDEHAAEIAAFADR
jgi:hypothetical protein